MFTGDSCHGVDILPIAPRVICMTGPLPVGRKLSRMRLWGLLVKRSVLFPGVLGWCPPFGGDREVRGSGPDLLELYVHSFNSSVEFEGTAFEVIAGDGGSAKVWN